MVYRSKFKFKNEIRLLTIQDPDEQIQKDLSSEQLSPFEVNLLSQISNLPTGLILIDKEGQIKFFNSRAETILGEKQNRLSKMEFKDWEVQDRNGDPISGIDDPLRAAANITEPLYDIQISIKKLDQQRVFLKLNISPLRDEYGLNGALVSFTDITDEIKTKEALTEGKTYSGNFNGKLAGDSLSLRQYQKLDHGIHQ